MRILRFNARQVGLVVSVLGLAVWASGAGAQTGTYTGSVYRDSLDHPLGETDILLQRGSVMLRGTTDAKGDFKIAPLAVGKYAVVFRHVGFAPLTDSIEVAANGVVDRAYEMVPSVVQLETVNVNDTVQRYSSPNLQEFLERKKTTIGGHFITEDVIRKNEHRKLQDIIVSEVPGVRVYQPFPKQMPTMEYLSSSRGSGRSGTNKCPITLYIDGAMYFNPQVHRDTDPFTAVSFPDLNRILPSNLAGVEFYPGGASLPAKYNATTNDCGVLLLWTREK